MQQELISTLQPLYAPFLDNNFEIYLVGGAVRDILLGKNPTDFDFTTNASPEDIQKLFRRTVPTGIQHGTVTVLIGSKSFEVTTFRVETGYLDHRKPTGVIFTASLEEDLRRRDFTINGMALHLPSGKLMDFHGGQEDLKNGIIRAIGEPLERFEEDALRILRACRFAAKLNFQIEIHTWEAIGKKRDDLIHLSKERVREELNKTLGSSNPGYGWSLIRKSGLLSSIGFQENFKIYEPEELEKHLDKYKEMRLPSRWCLILFLQCSDPISWLRNYTFSNLEIKDIYQRLDLWLFLNKKNFQVSSAQALWKWGERDLKDCDIFLTSLNELIKSVNSHSLLQFLKSLQVKAQSNDPVFLSDLVVNGKTVIETLGKPGGPWLGELLSYLLELVWKNPEFNTLEILKQEIIKNETKNNLENK